MKTNLTESEINFLYDLIEKLTGTNQQGSYRKEILWMNVAQQMQRLKISSLTQYLRIVNTNENEYKAFLSAITIHTTHWFREAPHFETLSEFLNQNDAKNIFHHHSPLSIWVPGCSTGEEVYSYGFLLELKEIPFYILGSDIDPISIEKAQIGIYEKAINDEIPKKFHSYLHDVVDSEKSLLAIDAKIKDNCHFIINDISILGEQKQFDVISCRNLLIYFDQEKVKKIINYFLKSLKTNGILILGHSESFQDYREYTLGNCHLQNIGNNCFKKILTSTKISKENDSTSAISFTANRKRILLVDDVIVARMPLKAILQKNNFEVIEASSAEEATHQWEVHQGKIDLIVLDIEMPGENGVEWLNKFRTRGHKIPVVISSSSSPDEIKSMMGLLVKGAQEYFIKDLVYKRLDLFVSTVTQLTQTKNNHVQMKKDISFYKFKKINPQFFYSEVIAIGASTGGPEAIFDLLKDIRRPTPPIVIVQHMAPYFTSYFAKYLSETLGLDLSNDEEGEILKPNTLYLAQKDLHLTLQRSKDSIIMHYVSAPAVHNIRPSIDYLFSSIAKEGIASTSIILTGMGKDGAKGLLEVARSEKSVTMAQDENSSVVYGMPKEAVDLGAVQIQGSISQLKEKLNKIIEQYYMKISS
ncbi:MAG: chemotaxis protein CheB [Bacteriovoracaceae bacterium]|nr:chemotaxis protein CheB [Bacteriovoracaceae bacterium]